MKAVAGSQALAAAIRRLLALLAVEPIAPGAPGGAPCTYLSLSTRAAAAPRQYARAASAPGQYNHVLSNVALHADRGAAAPIAIAEPHAGGCAAAGQPPPAQAATRFGRARPWRPDPDGRSGESRGNKRFTVFFRPLGSSSAPSRAACGGDVAGRAGGLHCSGARLPWAVAASARSAGPHRGQCARCASA